jgi:hypothetical protein
VSIPFEVIRRDKERRSELDTSGETLLVQIVICIQ